MKLTWKDMITTLLVIGGGAIVYAKYYSYDWRWIGDSWQKSVAALAVIGLLMFVFSSFNFANRSILNIGEMVLGFAAAVLMIVGVLVTSQPVFYGLAAVLGVLWLVDTARHVRHNIIGAGPTRLHHLHAH
jgi:hypothetical protein